MKKFEDWNKSNEDKLKDLNDSNLEIPNVPDAAVWMLEPRRLSEACHGSRSICGVNEDDIETINRYLGLSRQIPRSLDYPLPVIPNIVTPRISSQIGRFTLHTSTPKSLLRFANTYKKESDKEYYLIKFRIVVSQDKDCDSQHQHRDLMRSLRVAGISHMNISQDLDGIADELMWRVRLGTSDRSEMQNQ